MTIKLIDSDVQKLCGGFREDGRVSFTPGNLNSLIHKGLVCEKRENTRISQRNDPNKFCTGQAGSSMWHSSSLFLLLFFFYTQPLRRSYLFIIFSEEVPIRILVDGLSNPNDLAIAVADGHAQERLGFVSCQLVNFITEPTILQSTGTCVKQM